MSQPFWPMPSYWSGSSATLDSVTGGDLIPVFQAGNVDFRFGSVSTILDYFEQQFASPTVSTTVYVPTTGFNIAIGTPTSNLWVLMQPAGTLASGTITLPLNTIVPDGTEILVTSTNTVTTLTLAANGASNVFGGPTTIGATSPFRIRFYTATNSWYLVA
jgi:hypothetical protein